MKIDTYKDIFQLVSRCRYTTIYSLKHANTWWRHQMEAFSTLLAFCEGKPPVNGGFPSQRPVTRSFDFFFNVPEETAEQTLETPVIWDAIALIMTPLNIPLCSF